MPVLIVSLDPMVIRITLEGDVDSVATEGLRLELDGLVRGRRVWVEADFSHLRSIDSPAMEVLLSFFRDMTRIGCGITITGMRHQRLQCFDAILHASRLVN